jgi:hypothetical protein
MFQYNDMTEQEYTDFVKAHEWTYAKSMPTMPHAYVVRERCRADDEFCRAVLYIRKHGKPRKFFRKTYIYLDFGAYTYWTMGNSLEITKIINRAVL